MLQIRQFVVDNAREIIQLKIDKKPVRVCMCINPHCVTEEEESLFNHVNALGFEAEYINITYTTDGYKDSYESCLFNIFVALHKFMWCEAEWKCLHEGGNYLLRLKHLRSLMRAYLDGENTEMHEPPVLFSCACTVDPAVRKIRNSEYRRAWPDISKFPSEIKLYFEFLKDYEFKVPDFLNTSTIQSLNAMHKN